MKSSQRVFLHKWIIQQTINHVFFLNFFYKCLGGILFDYAICLLCKPKILKSQTEGNHLGPFRSTEGLLECRNFTLGSSACACLFHLVNLATHLASKFEELLGRTSAKHLDNLMLGTYRGKALYLIINILICEWIGLVVVYTIIKKQTNKKTPQCQNKCIIVITVAKPMIFW